MHRCSVPPSKSYCGRGACKFRLLSNPTKKKKKIRLRKFNETLRSPVELLVFAAKV